MTRYPIGEPLPASAGLYTGGGPIVQSMFDPDDVEPDYEPGEEPEVPLPDEPWIADVGLALRLLSDNVPDNMTLVLDDQWILAAILRHHGWTVTPPDPQAGPLVSRSAPETSRQAAASVRAGALEQLILSSLLTWGGWTCDEIEDATGRGHGSVSGAMNRLKRKGLVRESGETRPTRGGHPAAVYIRTEVDPIITSRSTP